MKKSEEIHLKYAINESTLSTAARFPFPNGEGYDTRAQLSPYCQSEYTHMWKTISTNKAFPSRGRCPEGADGEAATTTLNPEP